MKKLLRQIIFKSICFFLDCHKANVCIWNFLVLRTLLKLSTVETFPKLCTSFEVKSYNLEN